MTDELYSTCSPKSNPSSEYKSFHSSFSRVLCIRPKVNVWNSNNGGGSAVKLLDFFKKKKKKPGLLFDNAEETCIHSTAPQSKDDRLLPKVSEAACANANVSFEKWTARKLGVFLVRQCVFLLTQSWLKGARSYIKSQASWMWSYCEIQSEELYLQRKK